MAKYLFSPYFNSQWELFILDPYVFKMTWLLLWVSDVKIMG